MVIRILVQKYELFKGVFTIFGIRATLIFFAGEATVAEFVLSDCF